MSYNIVKLQSHCIFKLFLFLFLFRAFTLYLSIISVHLLVVLALRFFCFSIFHLKYLVSLSIFTNFLHLLFIYFLTLVSLYFQFPLPLYTFLLTFLLWIISIFVYYLYTQLLSISHSTFSTRFLTVL